MIFEKFQLFEDRPYVTLTCYIHEDSEEMLDGKKRPAILVCPGGAYAFCSDREADPIALRFAAMGYHAFILRYSVYSNCGIEFPKLGKDKPYEYSIQPNPMREIGTAMLKIREHAEEWLVDMDKIVLTGYSAGANNCAMFSVYWDKPIIYDFLGCKPEDIKPAAAVLGYGVFDEEAFHKSIERIGDQGRIEMNKYFNFNCIGKPVMTQEEMDFLSPAKQVSANTPPMFLWATYGDNTVPVSQTTIMGTALAENDIPFEMHIFEKGDHGLSVGTVASACAHEQMDADVAKWTELAERWLEKHILPDIPETVPPFELPKELFE